MARNLCDEYGMRLPLPKNSDRNDKISKFGESWIDLNVNDILKTGFEDFIDWERRKRAYLTKSGQWAIAFGGQSLRYFCVKKRKYICILKFCSNKKNNC